MITFTLMYSFSKGRKIVSSPIYILLIGLFILSLVSLASSDDISTAARNEITLLSGFLLVFIFHNICTNDLIYKRIILWIFRVAIIISIIAIVQNIYWNITGDALFGTKYTGYYNLFGGFYHYKSNAFFTGGLILGHYLLMPVILGMQLWPYIKKRKHRILIKTSVILSVIALFLTFSVILHFYWTCSSILFGEHVRV